MAKQPWGITLATILLVIGGAMTILSALTTILLGSALTIGTTLPITGTVIFMGIIYLILGGAYIAVAYFLWNHRTWAWWVATVLAAIGIISGLPSLIALSIIGILMLVLNVFVVIGLMEKKARKACKVKF